MSSGSQALHNVSSHKDGHDFEPERYNRVLRSAFEYMQVKSALNPVDHISV